MVPSIILRPLTLRDQVEHETRPDEQRQRVEELVDHRVGDIRVSRPDVPLREDGPKVGSPRVSRPPEDLLDEPPVWLHRREELGLLAALDVRVPPVRDHPSGEELVVPRVEVVLSEPEVVGEAVEELGVLEDDGTVRGGSTGEAGDTAVDVGRGGDFDVSDRETEGGEDLPDGHLVPDGLDTLRGPDSADLLVLEAGEHRGQEGGRPDCVVVRKDDDVCRCVSYTVTHLESLVGEGDGEDADPLRVDGVGELLERAEHALLGDDDDLLGLADEPRVGGLLELLSGVDGGHDDGHVLRGNVRRMLR